MARAGTAIGLALALSLTLTLGLAGASHEAPRAAPPAPPLWNPARAATLRDGDLVFRTGPDLTSRLVMAQRTGARFSHVGLVLWVGGQPQVLHAVPAEGGRGDGGVLLQPMGEFAAPARATDLALYRPMALDEAGRRALRAHALAQLGKPFDDGFVYSDDAQLFCTELVMKALGAAGLDAETLVPRVRVPLHDEAVPTPDDLRHWRGLMPLTEGPRS